MDLICRSYLLICRTRLQYFGYVMVKKKWSCCFFFGWKAGIFNWVPSVAGDRRGGDAVPGAGRRFAAVARGTRSGGAMDHRGVAHPTQRPLGRPPLQHLIPLPVGHPHCRQRPHASSSQFCESHFGSLVSLFVLPRRINGGTMQLPVLTYFFNWSLHSRLICLVALFFLFDLILFFEVTSTGLRTYIFH